MELPFERLAARREDVDLARDQLVEVAPGDPLEIVVLDVAVALQAEHALDRPVTLDLDVRRKRGGDPGAQLVVVRA